MTMYLAWRVSSQNYCQSRVDLLVADHDLHVLFDHEILMIWRQCLGRWVVPGEHVVSLHKCSTRTSRSIQLNMNFAKSL